MGTNGTLLCIHRDLTQLALLKENGYELVTASNPPECLRLLMSHPVDAVVLEHGIGFLDGAAMASELKRVRRQVPIVMVVDHMEVPSGVLESVDALVAKSDGAHFLWATVHFVLNVKPVQRGGAKLRAQVPLHLRRPGSLRESTNRKQSKALRSAAPEEKEKPLSPEVWKNIRNGNVRF